MIYISKNIYIDDSKIKFKGIRSPKPGGQNVNKVSSGIHLQYDLNGYKYPGTKSKNQDVINQAEAILPGIGEQMAKKIYREFNKIV